MSGHLQHPYLPLPVTDADLAFPAHVRHLMPAMDDIPVEFRRFENRWVRIFNDLFCGMAKKPHAVVKDGVNPNTAWRHLQCVMSSWASKHEHKEASFAFLASLWFDDIVYDKDE